MYRLASVDSIRLLAENNCNFNGIGVLISVIQLDWKMAGFQLALAGLVYVSQAKPQTILISIVLIAPALVAIPYEQNLEQYPDLIEALDNEIEKTGNQLILVTNNFLEFSEKVLFPNQESMQNQLHGLDYIFLEENLEADTINLFLYNYYLHSYHRSKQKLIV